MDTAPPSAVQVDLARLEEQVHACQINHTERLNDLQAGQRLLLECVANLTTAQALHAQVLGQVTDEGNDHNGRIRCLEDDNLRRTEGITTRQKLWAGALLIAGLLVAVIGLLVRVVLKQ